MEVEIFIDSIIFLRLRKIEKKFYIQQKIWSFKLFLSLLQFTIFFHCKIFSLKILTSQQPNFFHILLQFPKKKICDLTNFSPQEKLQWTMIILLSLENFFTFDLFVIQNITSTSFNFYQKTESLNSNPKVR